MVSLLTAPRELQQVTNPIASFQNQAQMLINQARNLASAESSGGPGGFSLTYADEAGDSGGSDAPITYVSSSDPGKDREKDDPFTKSASRLEKRPTKRI